MTTSPATSRSTSDETTSGRSTALTSSKNDSSDSPSVLDLSSTGLLVQKVKGRENKMLKAARLLVTGRLRVLRVDEGFISAECRGDSGEVYTLGFHEQHWMCSCPARTDCSHLNALWAVVAVSRSGRSS
jgi:hypothetical protein